MEPDTPVAIYCAYLRHRGEPVRVLVRDPQKYQALVTGNVGVFKGDVTDPASLREAMQGVDTVINLVAIIRERPGGVTFERINYGGTVNVVDAAKEVGIKRIIQQSALGARPDPKLPYFDTKYRAEQYLQQSGLSWAILRPSVIFGEGDEFVNKLADLVRKPLVCAACSDRAGRRRWLDPVLTGLGRRLGDCADRDPG